MPNNPKITPKETAVGMMKPKNSPPIFSPTKPNTMATAGLKYKRSSTALDSSVNRLLRLIIAQMFDV